VSRAISWPLRWDRFPASSLAVSITDQPAASTAPRIETSFDPLAVDVQRADLHIQIDGNRAAAAVTGRQRDPAVDVERGERAVDERARPAPEAALVARVRREPDRPLLHDHRLALALEVEFHCGKAPERERNAVARAPVRWEPPRCGNGSASGALFASGAGSALETAPQGRLDNDPRAPVPHLQRCAVGRRTAQGKRRHAESKSGRTPASVASPFATTSMPPPGASRR